MRLADMNTRKRTTCEVVTHVHPGIPGQGTTTRAPQAGGGATGRVSGRRTPQAGKAAGARRAAATAGVAARRAAPLADERRLIRPLATQSQLQSRRFSR